MLIFWSRKFLLIVNPFYFQSSRPYTLLAAFPLIILADFPQNLVFCKQNIPTDLTSNISIIYPDFPLRVPHLHCKFSNLQIYFLRDVVPG